MIGFHRLLIATAIFFFAGLGVWMLSAYWGPALSGLDLYLSAAR